MDAILVPGVVGPLSPWIHHDVGSSWVGGFGDFRSLEPIKHEFFLTCGPVSEEEVGPLRLKGFYLRDREDEGPEVIVARVSIYEYPTAFKERLGISWTNWLDWDFSEFEVVGEYMDMLEEECEAPSVGSLFYVDRVDVHPAFRGKRFGGSLIVHALSLMRRSTDDIALLYAMPLASWFDRGSGCNRSPDAIQKLVDYYSSLGFEEVAEVENEGTLLKFEIGMYEMPLEKEWL